MNFSSLLSNLINHSINGLKKLDPLSNSTVPPVVVTTTTRPHADDSVSASLGRFLTGLIKDNVIALKNLTTGEVRSPPIHHQKVNARIIGPAPAGDQFDPAEAVKKLTLVNELDSRNEPGFLANLKSAFTVSNDFLLMVCFCLAFVVFMFIMVRVVKFLY
jgi:hypothetical protein